tara:strand:- start:143 stop:364 length:222 start_codon:yes stop_codon:yes gene_type:complete
MLELENISKIKCRNGLERVDAKIKRVNAELKALKKLQTEFRAIAEKYGWGEFSFSVALIKEHERTTKKFSWIA